MELKEVNPFQALVNKFISLLKTKMTEFFVSNTWE